MGYETLKDKITKGKKITTDFIYNIIATILSTGILQIVIYPYLATKFSSDIYGQLLTIMGIANILTVAIGGGLNNAHLIQLNFYEKNEAAGDFNSLLFISTAIGTLTWAVMLLFSFNIKGISLLLLLLYVCIGILENYLVVAYRIDIDYKANLFYNILMSTGYLIGIPIAVFCRNWCIAFLCGELTGFIYLLRSTALYKIKPQKSSLIKKTSRVYLGLLFTTLIVQAVNYLDRFFLYPILGGEQVTVYTVSSFVGKSIGLLVTPIAGVLLSYYAKGSFVMTVKRYWIINVSILAAGIICGICIVVAGPWITKILYPTVITDAERYLIMANDASLISALTSILLPSVLKFANVLWQIIIQTSYAILYLLMGYIAVKQHGLWGFCVATLIVNILRMLFLVAIGHFSILKREKKNVGKS